MKNAQAPICPLPNCEKSLKCETTIDRGNGVRWRYYYCDCGRVRAKVTLTAEINYYEPRDMKHNGAPW